MKLATYTKQPSEVKDYDINYSAWLVGSDYLSSAEIEISCETDPTDATLIHTNVAVSADTAKVWLAGGTAGRRYKVTVRVQTNEGRIEESELIFNIREH